MGRYDANKIGEGFPVGLVREPLVLTGLAEADSLRGLHDARDVVLTLVELDGVSISIQREQEALLAAVSMRNLALVIHSDPGALLLDGTDDEVVTSRNLLNIDEKIVTLLQATGSDTLSNSGECSALLLTFSDRKRT